MPKSAAPRKRKPQKKAKKTITIDETQKTVAAETVRELREADRHCRILLGQTAGIAPLLLNKELVEQCDVVKVNEQSALLSKDSIRFKSELDKLFDQIPNYINPNDEEGLRVGLELAERYSEWQENYQACVLPIINTLSELLLDGAEKLKEVKRDDSAVENSEIKQAADEINKITEDLIKETRNDKEESDGRE